MLSGVNSIAISNCENVKAKIGVHGRRTNNFLHERSKSGYVYRVKSTTRARDTVRIILAVNVGVNATSARRTPLAHLPPSCDCGNVQLSELATGPNALGGDNTSSAFDGVSSLNGSASVKSSSSMELAGVAVSAAQTGTQTRGSGPVPSGKPLRSNSRGGDVGVISCRSASPRSPRTHMRHSSESALPAAAIAAAAAAALGSEPMEIDLSRRSEWQGVHRHLPPSR